MSQNEQLDWTGMLLAEVASSNRQQVANRLGVSRTAVSLLLAGKYGASTDAMAKRIVHVFGDVDCPVAGRLNRHACVDFHTAPAPLNNPMDMRHFRVCQSCIHNTKRKDKGHAKD